MEAEQVDVHYLVERQVFSEDSFTQVHEKTIRRYEGLLDHVIEFFKCDSEHAKNAGLSFFPITGWMKRYRIKQWLPSDVISGVSTGLVAVLQGLAFSLLAGLPPEYGLYSAFFPVLIYFFLGTSRHLSVGPFPILSLMVGSVVERFVPDIGPPLNITGFEELTMKQQRVIVASSITFLMGIFQLAMGLLRFGFIVIYLSDTLVSGFTTAAAVQILVSQLKFVLGLNVPGKSGAFSIFFNLVETFRQITSTNLHDLVTSIVVMVVGFIVKEVNERFKKNLLLPIPIEVMMTIIACGISYAFNFRDNYGVDVIGKIPDRFEPPLVLNFIILKETAVDSFIMSIVGFAVAFAVAKVYAVKHDYVIDGNQELIAFGASNIFGGAFKSLPASAAFSTSAVQESTGGKTQVAGLLSAIIVLIVTLAIGFLLEPLPKSVLGAVVIINLKGMLMQVCEVPHLWRKDLPDCVVWVVTFVASILLGLECGLAVGLGAQMIAVVIRTQFPHCCVLANISGTDIYRNHKDYVNIHEPEGVKIFRVLSPILFANIDFIRRKLIDAVGVNPLRVLRKRQKALKKMKKLIENRELTVTNISPVHDANELHATCSLPTEESEDESNMEDLDEPGDFSGLPIQVNWRAELPANISVPLVDIHSLVLDFSAVSFFDISALKGLKTVLKEFIRIDVDVYIVACDPYIIAKLKSCEFFDDEITTSIFFLTLHDVMLYILNLHSPRSISERVRKRKTKVCNNVNNELNYGNCSLCTRKKTEYEFRDQDLMHTVSEVCWRNEDRICCLMHLKL